VPAFVASGTFNADETIAYAYDLNDRLLTEVKDASGTTGDSHTSYAYGPANAHTEQTGKTVRAGLADQGTLREQHSYGYDLQQRLDEATVTKYQADGTTIASQSASTYAYDHSGIRVKETVTSSENGGSPTTTSSERVIDAHNPTGYQQILEEKDSVTGVVTKTYTIGHDVLTQHDAANGSLTLLYDGHGSTRALAGAASTILQRYAYDAYGVQLTGSDLTAAEDSLTDLLYSGEQFDAALGMQYLRARYYDPSTGRFTRLDPFAPDSADPRTLHRYLYGLADPISHIDPSGNIGFSLVELGIAAGLQSWMRAEHLKTLEYYQQGWNVLGHFVHTAVAMGFSALVFNESLFGRGMLGGGPPEAFIFSIDVASAFSITPSPVLANTGIGVNSTLDLVFLPRSNAVYLYTSLGASPFAAAGASVTYTWGYAWNVIDPIDYTGPSASLSVGLFGPGLFPGITAPLNAAFNGVSASIFYSLTPNPRGRYGHGFLVGFGVGTYGVGVTSMFSYYDGPFASAPASAVFGAAAGAFVANPVSWSTYMLSNAVKVAKYVRDALV
jgi:RHS repeat-associated protein